MTVVLINSIQNFIGLSSDTRPTAPPAGSTFTETNTGKKWIYNGVQWAEDLTLIYAVYEAGRA